MPIDRDDSDASRAALNTGLRVLREGKLLGIYPEGTRSPDGRLYRGKTGVARLALESGAVVLPCAMINTDKIQPQGRVLPKLRPRPGVRIGKPLDFSRYEGLAGDRLVERSITDEIMYALMQLSGQEYVDQYAADVKKAQGKDRAFGADERPRDARPHARHARRPSRCAFFYDCEFIEDGARSSSSRSASSTRPGASSTPCRPSSTRPARSTGCAATCWTSCRSPADPAWRSRERIRDDLLAFLTEPGEPIELWAWMAAYDHVVLAQLWGDMRALPRVDPAVHPRAAPALGGRRLARRCRPRRADQHDALADARHNLARWQCADRLRP